MKTSSTTSDYVHQQRLFDICIVLRIYLKQALRFEKSLPEKADAMNDPFGVFFKVAISFKRFLNNAKSFDDTLLLKCSTMLAELVLPPFRCINVQICRIKTSGCIPADPPSLIAFSWVPLILASNSAEDSALPADAPAAIPFRLLLIMDDSSKGFELVGIATLSWLRSIRDWRNASAALCATREACSSSFNFSSS
nr:hypothetical protein Iba_chr08cCG7060 [Ipomoea batatas]